MNRQDAIKIIDNIDIIKAFVNGENIQYRNDEENGGRWTTYTGSNPCFDGLYEWRVKPEPREFWLYPVGIGWRGVDSEDKAKPYSSVFKVREVIE